MTDSLRDAPEGFISKDDVLRVALEEGRRRGWCNELHEVLEERLGILIPTHPKVSLRATIEIPWWVIDQRIGANFFSTWTVENPVFAMRQDPWHGLSRPVAAFGQLVKGLMTYATDEYGSNQARAREVLAAGTYDIIQPEA